MGFSLGGLVKGAVDAVGGLAKDAVKSVENEVHTAVDGVKLAAGVVTGNDVATKNAAGALVNDAKSQLNTLADTLNNPVVQVGSMFLPFGAGLAVNAAAMGASAASDFVNNQTGGSQGQNNSSPQNSSPAAPASVASQGQPQSTGTSGSAPGFYSPPVANNGAGSQLFNANNGGYLSNQFALASAILQAMAPGLTQQAAPVAQRNVAKPAVRPA